MSRRALVLMVFLATAFSVTAWSSAAAQQVPPGAAPPGGGGCVAIAGCAGSTPPPYPTSTSSPTVPVGGNDPGVGNPANDLSVYLGSPDEILGIQQTAARIAGGIFALLIGLQIAWRAMGHVLGLRSITQVIGDFGTTLIKGVGAVIFILNYQTFFNIVAGTACNIGTKLFGSVNNVVSSGPLQCSSMLTPGNVFHLVWTLAVNILMFHIDGGLQTNHNPLNLFADAGDNFLAALLSFFGFLFVVVGGGYLWLEVIMLNFEALIVTAIGPVFLGFLGWSKTEHLGQGVIRYAQSVAIRTLLILGSMAILERFIVQAQVITGGSLGTFVAVIGASLAFAFGVFRLDRFGRALVAGDSSLGARDALQVMGHAAMAGALALGGGALALRGLAGLGGRAAAGAGAAGAGGMGQGSLTVGEGVSQALPPPPPGTDLATHAPQPPRGPSPIDRGLTGFNAPVPTGQPYDAADAPDRQRSMLALQPPAFALPGGVEASKHSSLMPSAGAPPASRDGTSARASRSRTETAASGTAGGTATDEAGRRNALGGDTRSASGGARSASGRGAAGGDDEMGDPRFREVDDDPVLRRIQNETPPPEAAADPNHPWWHDPEYGLPPQPEIAYGMPDGPLPPTFSHLREAAEAARANQRAEGFGSDGVRISQPGASPQPGVHGAVGPRADSRSAGDAGPRQSRSEGRSDAAAAGQSVSSGARVGAGAGWSRVGGARVGAGAAPAANADPGAGHAPGSTTIGGMGVGEARSKRSVPPPPSNDSDVIDAEYREIRSSPAAPGAGAAHAGASTRSDQSARGAERTTAAGGSGEPEFWAGRARPAGQTVGPTTHSRSEQAAHGVGTTRLGEQGPTPAPDPAPPPPERPRDPRLDELADRLFGAAHVAARTAHHLSGTTTSVGAKRPAANDAGSSSRTTSNPMADLMRSFYDHTRAHAEASHGSGHAAGSAPPPPKFTIDP